MYNKLSEKGVYAALVTGLLMASPAQADLRNSPAPMSISGVMEFEAAFGTDLATQEDYSGFALATFELGFEAKVNEQITINAVVLHEDGDTEPWEVDSGTISIDSAINIVAGRQFVPFGAFESQMVSDPLTLEFAETREAAVLLGFETDSLNASLYFFNGDSVKTGSSDTIDQSGFSLGYKFESMGLNFDLGFGYISSIGDTDFLQDQFFGGGGTHNSYIAGYALHGTIKSGDFTLITEYITAASSFETAELSYKGAGAQPVAFNLEANYVMGGFTYAAGVQNTAEALGLGMPETRMMFGVSFSPYENTTLAVEFKQEKDYSTVVTGNGVPGSGNSASTATLQLATEFQ